MMEKMLDIISEAYNRKAVRELGWSGLGRIICRPLRDCPPEQI